MRQPKRTLIIILTFMSALMLAACLLSQLFMYHFTLSTYLEYAGPLLILSVILGLVTWFMSLWILGDWWDAQVCLDYYRKHGVPIRNPRSSQQTPIELGPPLEESNPKKAEPPLQLADPLELVSDLVSKPKEDPGKTVADPVDLASTLLNDSAVKTESPSHNSQESPISSARRRAQLTNSGTIPRAERQVMAVRPPRQGDSPAGIARKAKNRRKEETAQRKANR